MALLEGALQSDRADRRRGPADDGAGGAGAGNSTVLGAAHRAAAHTNTCTRLHATSAYSHPAQTPAASVAQSARATSTAASVEIPSVANARSHRACAGDNTAVGGQPCLARETPDSAIPIPHCAAPHDKRRLNSSRSNSVNLVYLAMQHLRSHHHRRCTRTLRPPFE